MSFPENGGFGFPIDEIKDLFDEVISRGKYHEKTILEEISDKITIGFDKKKAEMMHQIYESDYYLMIRVRFRNINDPAKISSYFFIEKEDGSVGLEILVIPTNEEDWSVRIYNKKISSVYENVKKHLKLP